jgi:hypothetical protein
MILPAEEKTMRKILATIIISCVATAATFLLSGWRPSVAADKDGPMIVHNVYFTLKDNSTENKQKLLDACKKYLTKHNGELHFGAGVLAADFKRPVNDRDWDVGLHIVFKDRAAHDEYQEAARHKQFIEENKENWKNVRVFDTLVEHP